MSPGPDHTLVLRPRLQRADECLRPTRAEIDLGAIAHNHRVIHRALREGQSASTRVLAVIKADAYGHGVIPVARRLEAEGAYGFGVALAEEAIELRDAGIGGEILILNGIVGNAHEDVLERDLVPVVYDLPQLRRFADAARRLRRPTFRVHLKVDTGMCRLGVPHRELIPFLDGLRNMPSLRIEGLMTHLASADGDDEFTALQLSAFERSIATVRAAGHRPKVLHAANSAATFRHPSARYDVVRPGIALFGHPGFPSVSDDPASVWNARLKPAMRLRTEVIALKRVGPGDRVGYDGVYQPRSPRVLAILPVGYGDGLLRSTAGKGEVLVHGQRCPIVGRISMDLTHVDVTDVVDRLGVELGTEVVLLGPSSPAADRHPGVNEDMIHVSELAEAAGTAPYEVLTNVSRRVPRFYAG